jgi:hypothetical protein
MGSRRHSHIVEKDTHMADPPHHPDTGDDTGAEPDRESTGLPRWVWLVGIIAVLVALLVLIVILVGGGGHTPGPPPGGH